MVLYVHYVDGLVHSRVDRLDLRLVRRRRRRRRSRRRRSRRRGHHCGYCFSDASLETGRKWRDCFHYT